MLQRRVSSSAKRTLLQEQREDAIRESDSKRLLATEEREAQETKRKAIAEAAASFAAKRDSDLAVAAARRHSNWLQNCICG